eukprot:TRINITY_DN24831_c0_g1_i4.p1 TRINITY_DN24831_c0_g1~~TRINITY_DN24831_c0_g1_i4.p1  ORF type:complete len:219 (-),score=61.66 TRINITY_DN24831_c0_g1_i4:304-960(-)
MLRSLVGSEMCIRDRDFEAVRSKHPCFTEQMAEVFDMMHQAGCSRQHIEARLQSLPVFAENIEAVKYLHHLGVHQAILSDANTILIETVLRAHGLEDFFDAGIHTNPARWDDGKLRVRRYQEENACTQWMCQPNLCKGDVVQHILQADRFEMVAYVGDGGGDYCAVSRLRPCDHVLARTGYRLEQRLREAPVEAGLVSWEDGQELLDSIRLIFNQVCL